MTDFDALLTRSFAEAHEPVDDGFSVNVARGVARSENASKVRNAVYSGAMAIAGAAVAYGIYAFTSAFGQEFMASAGLEIARAHGALSNAPTVSASTSQGFTQSIQALGAILPQIMLVTAAVAGGAVAYRSTQD
jgi:hypothetical protein